ncbi:DUF5615 family PIN-like protein [Rubrivirga sp.]|uniref:DUF5615 family PIN-like protein n=1 Tax=Rubrivirga sp. TaxID=1885344 RepID=UPI003B5261D4
MRFKLDENLPAEAADVLREGGHDAATVLEQEMGGEPDPTVAVACQREGRALVTLDTDFADIRTYPPAEHPGLLVLRLRQQDKPHVLAVLRRVLPLFDVEPLTGRLWIVGEERVRVR